MTAVLIRGRLDEGKDVTVALRDGDRVLWTATQRFTAPETRIRVDMDTSRRKLAEHGFPIPSFLCWPYGEWNVAAKAIAKQCGFTHFLGFDTPAIFVSRDNSADGNLPRIPVLRKDETIPLNFPSDKGEQQSWWLAFLRVAIRTQSRTLLASNHRERYDARSRGWRPDLHLALWNPFQVFDVSAPAVVTWGYAPGALDALRAWLEGRGDAPGRSPVRLARAP